VAGRIWLIGAISASTTVNSMARASPGGLLDARIGIAHAIVRLHIGIAAAASANTGR